MQRPPVLVFAQSGRFIAQAATRAGYPVRVADCFADTDTQAVAENFIKLPALSALSHAQLLQLLVVLSQGQRCLLICGTGIEGFYPVLTQLPAHIEVVGNTTETLSLLREPQQFFGLLDQLRLPYPPSSQSHPPSAKPLRKRLDSAGGTAVFADTAPLAKGEFYQQKMPGETHSVCFIANASEMSILGWNRQVNLPGQYLLQQIWQHDAPPAHAARISSMLEILVKTAGLKGFNSLDYIVTSEGNIFILEINPRISASVALLPDADWFSWHLDSCRNLAMPAPPAPAEKPPVRLLHYCYADTDLYVADTPVWPVQCHDLPLAGSRIGTGQPICTLILTAASEQACDAQLKDCQQQLLKNCLRQA